MFLFFFSFEILCSTQAALEAGGYVSELVNAKGFKCSPCGIHDPTVLPRGEGEGETLKCIGFRDGM
jgi:hypothetical protein